MLHVQERFPSLALVVFDSGGRWQYMDEDFKGLLFDAAQPAVDVGILEDASAAVEPGLPCAFELAQAEDWTAQLHPGDEVTWNDPDEGKCSRTGIIAQIEFIGDDAARLTLTDGWHAEVLLAELS